MAKLTVLWADLTVNGSSAKLRERFAKYCDVRITEPGAARAPRLQGSPPNFSVLEYDYPDKRGLAILRRIKKQHPSVPLIMITKAHSEALAVWAFRAGAWDYLAMPVSEDDIERICSRMQHLIDSRTSDTMRLPALIESEPPVDTQYVARDNLATSLEPAMDYIRAHFAEKITEARVARACGMSSFRFSRAFRQVFKTTFRDSLLRYRITQGRRLLENPQLSITQVAFMSGFNDASHFGKMFRRFHGQTATEYRSELVEVGQDQWPATPPDQPATEQTGAFLYAPPLPGPGHA